MRLRLPRHNGLLTSAQERLLIAVIIAANTCLPPDHDDLAPRWGSQGKASTCLAYGYKVKLVYDGNGDRIPGLRDINEDEAEVIRWIFRQYADGVSPRDIAKRLNAQGTPGPRGTKWRDTAIRGHVSRGTGILNNTTYIGRVVWNRRQYRKNPETERRVARGNKESDWIVNDDHQALRIVDDALWARVKERQKEIGELFSYTTTNRLNGAHRPSYMLSGILECAERGGPYAIMAKDRYGCTNHKKHLPIDGLGGACCTNQKTILRQDIEDRVLSCLAPAFFGMRVFDDVARQVRQNLASSIRNEPDPRQRLAEELKAVEREQRQIIEQISDRKAEGHPRLAALDDMLDTLEERHASLDADLRQSPAEEEDFDEKIRKLKAEVSPEAVELILNSVSYYIREHADTETKQPFINIVHQFIQKVVIGKTPGHQPASLEVHGRIASILASMEAATILEKQFEALKQHDYLEELSVKRLEWQNI